MTLLRAIRVKKRIDYYTKYVSRDFINPDTNERVNNTFYSQDEPDRISVYSDLMKPIDALLLRKEDIEQHESRVKKYLIDKFGITLGQLILGYAKRDFKLPKTTITISGKEFVI
jgi:hypothetical protein